MYNPATFWPIGATWMITHAMEQYRFTGDKDALWDMFPTLKANAQFALDFLTEYRGYMVTNPSVSPENTYIIPNSGGKQASITAGPTIDNALVWELFAFIPEAQAALGIHDDDFATRVTQMRAKLPGLRVNQYGGIAEWLDDYEEVCHSWVERPRKCRGMWLKQCTVGHSRKRTYIAPRANLPSVSHNVCQPDYLPGSHHQPPPSTRVSLVNSYPGDSLRVLDS